MRLPQPATYAGGRALLVELGPAFSSTHRERKDPDAEFFGGGMASAQEVGRRIATVISPVASLVTAQGAGGALRQIIEIAIDGYGRLPSAKAAAARHLQRQAGSADEAISSIIDHHVRLASAQGFVTNIGGLATLPVAIPANITGVATVQVRMVAAIAHLRGYDLNDNRVRTALVMCLMGGEQVARHIAQGTLPTSPLAVATAPIFDPELDRLVSEEVLADLAARIGGKNVALAIVKRVPLMGGGVSAVMDGIATYQIGRYATGELVRRRALVKN
jgi:EcsC protein family